jgi:hypothetical protein
MDDNTIQLVLAVLIGVGYAVAAAVKKIDRWIQTNRLPREARERQSAPRPDSRSVPVERESSQSSTGEKPAPKPHAAPRDLMRELERAFGVVIEEEEPAAPPVPIPVPAPKPPPPDAREGRARDEQGVSSAVQRRAAPTAVSAARGRNAIRVRQRGVGHLAILRDRDDLRRGILAREILGPPKALRRQLH